MKKTILPWRLKYVTYLTRTDGRSNVFFSNMKINIKLELGPEIFIKKNELR